VWNGKYYLFVSVLGKNGLRGTEISVSDTPDGIFTPLADRPATPLDQSAIDGTLFCEDGIPYIVYSRDWPHCFDEEATAYVGEIWARALMAAARGAKESDVKMYFLDQLRWCGLPCQAPCVRALGAASACKGVKDFANWVADELDNGAAVRKGF
jgi:hypothetical protein